MKLEGLPAGLGGEHNGKMVNVLRPHSDGQHWVIDLVETKELEEFAIPAINLVAAPPAEPATPGETEKKAWYEMEVQQGVAMGVLDLDGSLREGAMGRGDFPSTSLRPEPGEAAGDREGSEISTELAVQRRPTGGDKNVVQHEILCCGRVQIIAVPLYCLISLSF